MVDTAPLSGRRVAVPLGDAALSHARRLLGWLGADVVEVSDPDTTCVVEPREGAVSANEDWARSGAMTLTGRADRPPLLAPGAPASAVRGALLAFEALTAARGVGCEPLPGVQLLGERAVIAGFARGGPRSVGGSYQAIATRDGWAGLSLARPADLELVPALIEADVGGDEWCAVTRWAASRTASEVAARAQLLGLAGVPLAELV